MIRVQLRSLPLGSKIRVDGYDVAELPFAVAADGF
jgi:hypothetical protein